MRVRDLILANACHVERLKLSRADIAKPPWSPCPETRLAAQQLALDILIGLAAERECNLPLTCSLVTAPIVLQRYPSATNQIRRSARPNIKWCRSPPGTRASLWLDTNCSGLIDAALCHLLGNSRSQKLRSAGRMKL